MLTKAQKMQMVSDAIDKGFKVELVKHDAMYEDANELIKIFGDLPVKTSYADDHAWFWVNVDGYGDKFEATIHLK